jgi:hypothetical protein
MTWVTQTRLGVGVLWLAFAIIFGALATYHWRQSGLVIAEFHTVARPGAASGSVKMLGMDIDRPLNDFAEQFNAYLREQNSNSRTQNLAAFAGYVLALFTALISAVLEFYPHHQKSGDGIEHEGPSKPSQQVGERINGGEPQRAEPGEER